MITMDQQIQQLSSQLNMNWNRLFADLKIILGNLVFTYWQTEIEDILNQCEHIAKIKILKCEFLNPSLVKLHKWTVWPGWKTSQVSSAAGLE